MPLRIPKLSRILTSTHGGLNQVVTFRAFSVDYSIEQTDAAGDQMLSPYGVVASTEILPPKKSLPETPQRLSGKNTHRQQSVTENTARKTGLIDNPVVRFLPIFRKRGFIESICFIQSICSLVSVPFRNHRTFSRRCTERPDFA